jgi:hypothetical protein
LTCVDPGAQDEDMMQAISAAVSHAPCHNGALVLGLALCALALPARAIEIYRCPGPPAVYTSDLHLVRAGRCTRLGAAATKARSAAAAQVSTSPVVAAATPGRAAPAAPAIAPGVQQQRDSDRVQILQTEVTRERDRLAQLTQQLQQIQSTEPEVASVRRSDAVALSQAIQRSESDLQALDKELARAQR